jgi:hypothetical protein
MEHDLTSTRLEMPTEKILDQKEVISFLNENSNRNTDNTREWDAKFIVPIPQSRIVTIPSTSLNNHRKKTV